MAGDTTKRRRGRAEGSLLIKLEEETWYDFGKGLDHRNATSQQTVSVDLVRKYRAEADELYRKELLAFQKSGKSSDERWVESTARKGTLKDRIAAMSVTVSTDPVHKLDSLDGLLHLAGCDQQQTNTRVAQLAAEALEDVFVSVFLPPDRKLVTLAQRPLALYESQPSGKTKKTLSPRILLLWRLEEMIKEKYGQFLQHYMGKILQDSVEMQKIAAVRSAAALLRQVPEGEAVLLQMLVNKLGDPEKKVAAAAGHELRKVLKQHSAMQTVVAREVQQLVHRPHISDRVRNNAINFLNQLVLRVDNRALASSLVSTYFRLFDVAVKKKNGVESEENGMKSRLLSALLTGVNRARPYLPAQDQKMEEHIDALYRVCHVTSPSASTQSLLLLFHLAVGASDKRDAPSEQVLTRQNRFYRALYSTLSKPAMLGAGKHLTMFFNLLYKAMKYDSNTTRVIAFCKRIMCTVLHCNSAIVASSLYLINEIVKYHPAVRSCYDSIPTGQSAGSFLDPSKREPRGALVVADGDDKTKSGEFLAPLWEMSACQSHYHPSINVFARTLGDMEYQGDPLQDFSLAQVLDKFAYRNPKASAKADRRRVVRTPVNDPSFLQQDNVAENDEFFRRFFAEQARRDRTKGIVRHKPTKDDDEKAEEYIMDDSEERQVDGFNDFDYDWSTDEEEEAFVDKLTQKIMEDSADVYGPVELDDEDPDMEGWDDMDDDHDASIEDEDDEGPINDAMDDDADAFMDDDDESSADENSMEGNDEYIMDDDEGEEVLRGEANEDMLVLGESLDEDDETEAEEEEPSKSKNKKKKFTSTFAALEEYEELIDESRAKLASGKRSAPDMDKEDTAPNRSKKKKRRKSKA